MRSRRVRSAFCGVAVVLGASVGCADDPGGATDLAKLPPPSQGVVDRAKALPLPKSPPKFGSPPKSQMVVPKSAP
jgi:hypothetical protein